MSDDFLVRLTTNPATTWWIRNVASRVDPWLFRVTNGRMTTFGPPAMPMVTLTTKGRRSGKPREVHLACIEHAGDRYVVASAMGQERHPGWRYNLEAHPEIEVQATGERYKACAEVLSDVEKKEIWEHVKEVLPMMNVYEGRTDRNIRVFRLRRTGAKTESKKAAT